MSPTDHTKAKLKEHRKRTRVRRAQQAMNKFVKWGKLGLDPIPTDGDKGPRTKERIKLCKELLGYGKKRRNVVISDEFMWRLAHPRKKRMSKEFNVKISAVKRGKRRRKRRRKALRAPAWSWLWGGSRGVTEEIIDIVGGRAPITSRKRSATDPLSRSNPSSDHSAFNLLADAVDFGVANAYDLAKEIARKLTGRDGAWSGDYASFNIVRRGKTYRVQIIAGTHGTGPHLHVGVRRA